nr:TonB-dependent receptor [uncultured Sphingosinicella sp.]
MRSTRAICHIRSGLLAATALALLPATAAAAQQPPAPGPGTTAGETSEAQDAPGVDGNDQSNEGETIIVTGTSRARAALDTPLAVTTLDDDRLAKLSSSSQADILNTIPTIKADAGGGEVATNVFIRGLPSGGQFQFTPLMYDGIPVFSTFGLNSSAYDVYYRNDLGIERLEFVRGGVSNLFGPGSVAGLINYINRTGSERTRGIAQIEVAERDRYRGDFAISGPLGTNLFYALSGYYRYDEGPIRTGLDTEGFQLRGNLKHEFADGGGSITLYGQYIDDKVVFYLPIPLDGTTRNRVPGNDGRVVRSVQHNRTEGLGFMLPTGPYVSDIEDSVSTQGGQLALVFEREFGNGWGLNARTKYSDYDHKFGLWSDGDGVVNVPESLQGFLTNRNLGTLANATFTFADDGSAVPANFLVFANRFTDRDRPARDFTAEINLTKELTTGSVEHTFTLGGFYGNARARDVNITTRYLAEFNNQPRLINVVVRNPTTGAQTIISRNGLLDASVGNYVNNRHQAERYAFYVADQIEGERFNFDIGARVERLKGDIRRERASTFVTDPTTPNLSTALRDVSFGNGGFLTGEVDTTEWAVAAGALYKITDDFNVYANASRGYFFPELRSVTFQPLPAGTPANASASPPTQSYSGEIIKQAEVGVKYGSRGFTATLAGLYTKLTNRRQVLFVNAPGGGFEERVNLVATESYGVEATVSARLFDVLTVEGNVTLQDHKYTQFQTAVAGVPTPNPAIIGNELERQPNLLYNVGLYYDDDRLDASIFTNYTGENFVASNNLIELEGWHVVNLDAGYKFDIGGERLVRLGVNVFNLFNSDAVTEGSPRQDNSQSAGGAFFVGRPVLPRRITGRLTFNF